MSGVKVQGLCSCEQCSVRRWDRACLPTSSVFALCVVTQALAPGSVLASFNRAVTSSCLT